MATTSQVDYEFLREIVYRFLQNVLDSSRDYTLFQRDCRAYCVSFYSEARRNWKKLVQHLRIRKNPALERAVAEAMTINETSFFRDGRPFELLRTELLPALIEARRTTRSLRFWSAACSTGQEGYSLAMLLREHFPFVATWNIRIDGTDIASEVVERAKVGRYHRIEMNRGLPARHIVRYFDHLGEDWIAKPEIQQLCHFRVANLSDPHRHFSERFDVIFLRNVMLYFSLESRRTLLAQVHRLLAPDGFLFLGSAEQPVDPSLWTSILAGGTCHFRPRKVTTR